MNKKNTLIFLIYFFIYNAIIFSNTKIPPKKILEQSNIAIQKGNYKEALLKISSIDKRKDLELHDDIKKAYEISIIAYWKTNKIAESKQSMMDLLLIDNQATLQAFITPPDLLDSFNEEKNKLEVKKSLIVNNKTIKENNIYKKKINDDIYYNFLPFGLNHYYTNNKNKALIQFSLQTSFLSINISSFWVKKFYEDRIYNNQGKKNNYKQAFDNAQIVQMTALAALVVSYSFSFIDSLLSYYN